MSAPTTSSYKPSPLSYGSPRASPFRRPESPATVVASPITTTTTAVRPSTPTTHQSAQSTRPSTPSRLQSGFTGVYTGDGASKFSPNVQSGECSPSRTTSPGPALNSPFSRAAPAIVPAFQSPRYGGGARPGSSANTPRPNSSSNAPSASQGLDALTHLPPAQVRELREAFQILDRDGDGVVDRADVTEMLGSLGLPTSSTHVGPYFSGKPSESLTLPAFLGMLSTLLAPLSAPAEMLAALAAFDDDDSGQVDVGEIMDAVIGGGAGLGLSRKEAEEAMKGFVGKRAFGEGVGIGRADVFRYREWVGALGAVGAGGEASASPVEKIAS